jgi:hypothetical protein
MFGDIALYRIAAMLYYGYHAMNNEWITVANASRILGVSKQAIRQRIYRNTISHRKDAEGTVFVRITEPNPGTNGDSYGEHTAYTEDANRELIDELRDRVGFLERQLDTEQAASAELRRIVAGLVQRVPELEPAREPRESPETTAPEGPEGGVEVPPPEEKKRKKSISWWRRKIFGA